MSDPLQEILDRLETSRRARVVGLHSAARGWVLCRLIARMSVTANEDSAGR